MCATPAAFYMQSARVYERVAREWTGISWRRVSLSEANSQVIVAITLVLVIVAIVCFDSHILYTRRCKCESDVLCGRVEGTPRTYSPS